MAHAALVNDQIHMNGLDMNTWTDTFGVPTYGFYKDQALDGSYIRGTDETPAEGPDPNPAMDHFDPLRTNLSGPMYVKEIYPKYAPSRMFPARKFEYPDGTVTWARPGLPFNFESNEPPRKGWFAKAGDDILPVLLLVLVILAFLFRKNLKFLKA